MYKITTDNNAVAVNSYDEVVKMLEVFARSADFLLEYGKVVTIKLEKLVDDKIVLAPEELTKAIHDDLIGFSENFTAVVFKDATTTISARGVLV